MIQNYKQVYFSKMNLMKSKHCTNFVYEGSIIDCTSTFTYLGVVLSVNGRFKEHIKHVHDKGRRAMFSIIAKSREFSLPVSVQIDLFKTMVIPILTYGCEVWGYENVALLDSLQLKFIRYILRLKSCTPIPMLYGETGLLPLSYVIKNRMLSFYGKVSDIDCVTLSGKMFNVMMYFNSEFLAPFPWLSYIEKMFIELGDIASFKSRRTISDAYIKWAKCQLKDVYISQWFAKLSALSKCDTYCMFKSTFGEEKYLFDLPSDLAISLCKFRTSNHKLEIERMRFDPMYIPRNERFCTKCTPCNELSSEYHHVFYCDAFKALRERLIPKTYLRRPNICKFVSLMSSTKRADMSKLAKFVKESQKSY